MVFVSHKPADAGASGQVTAGRISSADWEQAVPVSGRRLVRRIFAGCLFLLLCQYGLTFAVGEPFPALILPGFRGAGYEGNSIEVPRLTVDFEQNGQVIYSCSHSTLLERLPRSYHGSISKNVLSPREVREHSIWFRERISPGWPEFLRLCPGFHRAHRNHLSGADEAALRKWLRKRAEILVPEAAIDAVTVRWEATTFDMQSSPPARGETRFAGQLRISLDASSSPVPRIAGR